MNTTFASGRLVLSSTPEHPVLVEVDGVHVVYGAVPLFSDSSCVDDYVIVEFGCKHGLPRSVVLSTLSFVGEVVNALIRLQKRFSFVSDQLSQGAYNTSKVTLFSQLRNIIDYYPSQNVFKIGHIQVSDALYNAKHMKPPSIRPYHSILPPEMDHEVVQAAGVHYDLSVATKLLLMYASPFIPLALLEEDTGLSGFSILQAASNLYSQCRTVNTHNNRNPKENICIIMETITEHSLLTTVGSVCRPNRFHADEFQALFGHVFGALQYHSLATMESPGLSPVRTSSSSLYPFSPRSVSRQDEASTQRPSQGSGVLSVPLYAPTIEPSPSGKVGSSALSFLLCLFSPNNAEMGPHITSAGSSLTSLHPLRNQSREDFSRNPFLSPYTHEITLQRRSGQGVPIIQQAITPAPDTPNLGYTLSGPTPSVSNASLYSSPGIGAQYPGSCPPLDTVTTTVPASILNSVRREYSMLRVDTSAPVPTQSQSQSSSHIQYTTLDALGPSKEALPMPVGRILEFLESLVLRKDPKAARELSLRPSFERLRQLRAETARGHKSTSVSETDRTISRGVAGAVSGARSSPASTPLLRPVSSMKGVEDIDSASSDQLPQGSNEDAAPETDSKVLLRQVGPFFLQSIEWLLRRQFIRPLVPQVMLSFPNSPSSAFTCAFSVWNEILEDQQARKATSSSPKRLADGRIVRDTYTLVEPSGPTQRDAQTVTDRFPGGMVSKNSFQSIASKGTQSSSSTSRDKAFAGESMPVWDPVLVSPKLVASLLISYEFVKDEVKPILLGLMNLLLEVYPSLSSRIVQFMCKMSRFQSHGAVLTPKRNNLSHSLSFLSPNSQPHVYSGTVQSARAEERSSISHAITRDNDGQVVDSSGPSNTLTTVSSLHQDGNISLNPPTAMHRDSQSIVDTDTADTEVSFSSNFHSYIASNTPPSNLGPMELSTSVKSTQIRTPLRIMSHHGSGSCIHSATPSAEGLYVSPAAPSETRAYSRVSPHHSDSSSRSNSLTNSPTAPMSHRSSSMIISIPTSDSAIQPSDSSFVRTAISNGTEELLSTSAIVSESSSLESFHNLVQESQESTESETPEVDTARNRATSESEGSYHLGDAGAVFNKQKERANVDKFEHNSRGMQSSLDTRSEGSGRSLVYEDDGPSGEDDDLWESEQLAWEQRMFPMYSRHIQAKQSSPMSLGFATTSDAIPSSAHVEHNRAITFDFTAGASILQAKTEISDSSTDIRDAPAYSEVPLNSQKVGAEPSASEIRDEHSQLQYLLNQNTQATAKTLLPSSDAAITMRAVASSSTLYSDSYVCYCDNCNSDLDDMPLLPYSLTLSEAAYRMCIPLQQLITLLQGLEPGVREGSIFSVFYA